ncbi:hypothetical protein [Chitinophaga sp. 212800010-3]|uniref:hypothetical protein n=1 Tax=unclassified Chitinophaga TaxID=2619133 RepID=UPI002DF4C53F|nr:hypothetical protein [Chitinophaga sp. 212800010-3]
MDAINLRHVLALSLFLFFGITIPAAGQSSLQRKVLLPSTYIRFDSLLAIVSRQTGARFSVNTRKFPPSRVIRLSAETIQLSQLLAEIKHTTGIRYKTLGGHIIFVDSEPTKKKVVPVPDVQHWNLHAIPRMYLSYRDTIIPADIIGAHNQVVSHKPTTPDDTAHHFQLTFSRNRYISNGPFRAQDGSLVYKQVRAPRREKRPWIFSSRPRYARPEVLGRSSEPNQLLLLNAGVYTTELFYLNPAIQAGVSFLYGIISRNSNFNLNSIQWGVGSSIGLGENWRLHLQLTTGNVSRNYDTLTYKRKATARLLKGALLADRQISSRFRLQFGVTYNNMQTHFYQNDAPFVLEPGMTDLLLKNMNFIDLPFTISKSYTPDKGLNTKSWIGGQVGLFYNINFSRRR